MSVNVDRRSVLCVLGSTASLGITGCLGLANPGPPAEFAVEWDVASALGYDGNHHAIAVATADDGPVVAVPHNDLDGSSRCGLAMYDGSGTRITKHRVEPTHCTPHAVGDVGVGPFGPNGRPHFLFGTEARTVYAVDARTAEVTLREPLLDSIGYGAPVTGPFLHADEPAIATMDFEGGLHVAAADGAVAWERDFDGPSFVGPLVLPTAATGERPGLAVAHGRSDPAITRVGGEGDRGWRTPLSGSVVSWSWFPNTDDRPAIIAATNAGSVTCLDLETGDRRWTHPVGDRLTGCATADGTVFATGDDGIVRALAPDDGAVRWEQPVTDQATRLPPPAVGRIDPDGGPVVVTTAYDGTVGVFEAVEGTVLARRRFEASVYVAPGLADVTGSGADDVLVLFGDGRLIALTVST